MSFTVSYLSPSALVNGDSSYISCNCFIHHGRINNKYKRTAPKSQTSSVEKTGFVGSLVSPTFRLKPNLSPIPLPPTRPPLLPPLDPDQNHTSVPLHCPRTPTGAPPSCPAIDTPKPTSPPRASPPPYQVSFHRLTSSPLLPYVI